MSKLLNDRWFLLIIIALTWGSSFILIKKSLLEFSPFQIGAIRVGVSGLLLLYIGLPALRKLSKKSLFWVILTGFFGNFLPMFLFPLAQTQVSSSLAGILDSLVPVFVLILGFIFFGMKSQRIQVVGALLGFLGAAALMGFSGANEGKSQWAYALLVVLATASYALAALIIKEKLQHIPSMELSGSVFAIWMSPSFIILFFSGFFNEFNSSPAQMEALGYLGILTVLGTAIAMILYYKLIQNTSAIFASSVTYLLPIVAVIWGILDGESFSVWNIVGAIMILVGIYLIQEKPIPGQSLHENSE